MEFTLDCRDSMDAIHTQLAEVLSFPAWYGRNLDALHDCLSEISADITIHLLESDLHPRLRRVLQDCAEENPHIRLIY